MRIVIFEGADGVGKTTAKKMLDRECGYKHIVFERGFYSNYIYNLKFKRKLKGCPLLLRNLNQGLVRAGYKEIVLVLVFRSNIGRGYKRDQELFLDYFWEFVERSQSQGWVITNDKSLSKLRAKVIEMSEWLRLK